MKPVQNPRKPSYFIIFHHIIFHHISHDPSDPPTFPPTLKATNSPMAPTSSLLRALWLAPPALEPRKPNPKSTFQARNAPETGHIRPETPPKRCISASIQGGHHRPPIATSPPLIPRVPPARPRPVLPTVVVGLVARPVAAAVPRHLAHVAGGSQPVQQHVLELRHLSIREDEVEAVGGLR